MMRPQWIALAGGAIVGTLLFVSGAAADDFDTCDQQSGDVAIAACTRGITSGEYSGDRLAVLYNDRGVEDQKKGDLDRAIADYGEAIKDNPKFIRAYENRIKANVKKGEYDRAFADYSAVIELDPSFANFINRGMLY